MAVLRKWLRREVGPAQGTSDRIAYALLPLIKLEVSDRTACAICTGSQLRRDTGFGCEMEGCLGGR